MALKIAIDKETINKLEFNNKHEYIYAFKNETLDELLKLNMHCINYKELEYADINLTNYDIDCIKKTKPNEKDWDKIPKAKDYKFAIIVPNCNNDHGKYKGKTYLQNCIESILNQTYKNFKLIIIDDMSNDTSIETIKSYCFIISSSLSTSLLKCFPNALYVITSTLYIFFVSNSLIIPFFSLVVSHKYKHLL